MVSICKLPACSAQLSRTPMYCSTALLCSSMKACAMPSGSDSPASGSSSNTATQVKSMDQAEGVSLNMLATAAHQNALPSLDRPLPIRKRQRKPNRKTVQTSADSHAVTSLIRKQGRQPKAVGRTQLSFILLLQRFGYVDLGRPGRLHASPCRRVRVSAHHSMESSG